MRTVGGCAMPVRSSDRSRSPLCQLRQPALEEAPFRAVVGELPRASIGVTRLVHAPEAAQELSPRRVQVAEIVETEVVEDAQTSLRAVGLGDGDRAVELHDGRAGQARELAV